MSFHDLLAQSITTLEQSSNNQPMQMVGNVLSNYLKQTNITPTATWKPVYSITDTTESLVIYMDLPGVASDAINMKFLHNIIDVSGERQIPSDDLSQRVVPYGKFSQRIPIPLSVTNPKSVTTRMKDGVLKISIDKAMENLTIFDVTIEGDNKE